MSAASSMNAHGQGGLRASVIVRSGGREKAYEVRASDGIVTIGRDANCTVVLKTDVASRRHVLVDLRGVSMRVEDASTNGTTVGGVLVQRSAVDVPFGTPIVVGEYTLVIDLASRTASAQRPVAREPSERQEVHAAASAPTQDATAAKPKLFVQAPEAPQVEAAPSPWGASEEEARAAEVALRGEVHKKLIEYLDLSSVQTTGGGDDKALRSKVLTALRTIVESLDARIPSKVDRHELIGALADEALGLGPLEGYLSDPAVNEIMVVDPNTIYLERKGKLVRAEAHFTNDDRVRAAIERIVTPLGRRIDESVPLVDARLSDGSRVNAVIRPLALRGSAITIRKFSRSPLTIDKLVGFGAMTERMANFLTRSVIAKKNIVIAGGTGSGKTTLLNALSAAIPSDERIVTIEDAAELQLKQPHVVSLETRPPNMEGNGEYTIRDLVKNALRMRPDRIVVGECRGGEALDMLQAMNTGHDGSLTTTHANSAREAVARLETLVLMAGLELPVRAIREQIAGSVQLFVQQSRLSDGSRRVTSITEVTGIDDNGEIQLVPIFEYVRTGTGPNHKVLGEFRATGFLPTYLNDFLVMNLVDENEDYL